MFVNSKIKTARKELKLSVERLADKIAIQGHRVSRQTIWNWENSRTTPGAVELEFLSRALEKPIVYFFDKNYIISRKDIVNLRKNK